ncbi:hypothetical protein [Lentzea aerocolonigenes]|nr:hypothetical protein [Lentzea aerocolonigenes]
MRGINTVVAVVAMAAATVAFGQSATAQTEDVAPVFKMAPDVLTKGQDFQVQVQEGTCPGGLESVTSPGFAAPLKPGDLTGRAGKQAGDFTATAKCKGSTKTGTAGFQVLNRNFFPLFKIVPDQLKPGQAFEVQIDQNDCPDGGMIYSDGFREKKLLNTVHGVAGDKPGNYFATLYCSTAGTIYNSASFEIVPLTANDRFTLDKAEYAPGEQIKATAPASALCIGNLSSTGFVAPIKLARESDQLFSGTGKTIEAPGDYVASMTCNNMTVTQNFKVTAQKPKAKAPVVKPKGAPQTGGGGTA